VRLHSIGYFEKRAQPCPYCGEDDGLAFICEDGTDGDTYRCVACRCWACHVPLNDGSCGLIFGKGKAEKSVRCAPYEGQEVLPLG
jgi:hypothetical protein